MSVPRPPQPDVPCLVMNREQHVLIAIATKIGRRVAANLRLAAWAVAALGLEALLDESIGSRMLMKST